MGRIARSLWRVFGVLVLLTQVGVAADAGIVAKKIVLLDKIALGDPGPVKFVFVGGPDSGIQKGPAGDPLELVAELEWSYETQGGGSVGGAFDTPVATPQWTVNSEVLAKFKNTDPCGGSCLKSIVVKVGKLFKATSRTLLSDLDIPGSGSLFLGPPTSAEGILVVATIENGIDDSTHRMCTRFAVDLGSTVIFKEVGGGLGRKLVGKGGVPASCP